MTLAFSYLRFSAPEQRKGDSYRRQRALAERYAERHGLSLDARSYQDLGTSAFRGENLERGSLGVFLDAVSSGIIPKGSYLLVENLDRLSRDKARRAIRTLEDICDSGIVVVTLTDERVYDTSSLDNDPMAMMYAYMIATRANEESETKSRRLRHSWKQKRNKAYRSVPMTARLPGWLELSSDRNSILIVPDRAEVIKRIFRSYLAGDGVARIAQRLNVDGVMPFGRAAYWNRSYIRKILANPAVTGAFTPHEVSYDKDGKRIRKPLDIIPDYYPPVIDGSTFASALAMQEGKRAPSARTNGRAQVSHLFAGLTKCPKCWGTMLRVNKGSPRKAGRPKLVCSRAKQGAGCGYRSVSIERLEEAFKSNIDDLFYSIPKESQTLVDLQKRLNNEKEATQRRIDRFMNFIANGDGDPSDSIRGELAKSEARQNQIRKELEELEIIIARSSLAAQYARIRELRQVLSISELDVPKANALLRQIFTKVYVRWDEDALDFVWQHGGHTRLLCRGL